MSSLWRVLALAWLSAGAPSPTQESLLSDQVIACAAETDGEASVTVLGAAGSGRPAARPCPRPGRK